MIIISPRTAGAHGDREVECICMDRVEDCDAPPPKRRQNPKETISQYLVLQATYLCRTDCNGPWATKCASSLTRSNGNTPGLLDNQGDMYSYTTCCVDPRLTAAACHTVKYKGTSDPSQRPQCAPPHQGQTPLASNSRGEGREDNHIHG